MAGKSGHNGGGFLDGLTTLVEKLAELAEKGEQLQRSGGTGGGEEGAERGLKAVYGLNVRIGGAGGSAGHLRSIPRVEPFGNVRRDAHTGEAVVHQIREPLVDVFEEGADVLVVAELPGIDEKDVALELHEDVLTLHAERGKLKYHKEVLLPRRYSSQQLHTSCRNGVLEIRLSNPEEAPP